jgi:hypothetical protein
MSALKAARKVALSKLFFSQLISLLTNKTEMLSSSITRQHPFPSNGLVPVSALGGDCDALG